MYISYTFLENYLHIISLKMEYNCIKNKAEEDIGVR
jgi:hypothetical protein